MAEPVTDARRITATADQKRGFALLFGAWLARSVATLAVVFLVAGLTTAEADDAGKLEAVYSMYAAYRAEFFPGVTDIYPRAAMALVEAGKAVFIDTRQPDEMAVSMLPGAVTREQFLAAPARYAGKTAVAYCTISYRSGLFARDMAAKGVRIYNLAGGLLAWALEGGKLYDAAGETRRIHVYGPKWDYPPQGYESVRFSWFQRIFD